MPRKTKDDELKEEKKVAKKTDSKKKSKATSTKKIATKKEPTTAKTTTRTKKVATSTSTKTTPKKTAVKKDSSTASKKSATTKATAKTTSKKKSTTKTVTKKADAEKNKKVAPKKTTTKKSSAKKSALETSLPALEYYDLPYRYNQTVVKVLAQNPHTLFVYWDISDSDRKDFIKKYGDNFFNATKPVLVVHNLTDNYTYEIDINDFANNWYIHVDDSKCEYSIELGRRIRQNNQDIKHEYLNVAYSNAIEIPNDHILYFKENDKIYFKNIKTNRVIEKTFKNSLYANSINEIYKNHIISESQDTLDMQNPSSDFLSSNIL